MGAYATDTNCHFIPFSRSSTSKFLRPINNRSTCDALIPAVHCSIACIESSSPFVQSFLSFSESASYSLTLHLRSLPYISPHGRTILLSSHRAAVVPQYYRRVSVVGSQYFDCHSIYKLLSMSSTIQPRPECFYDSLRISTTLLRSPKSRS